MVDTFSLLLSHVLMLIAFWRLLHRDDLDREAPPEREPVPEGFAHQGAGLRRRADRKQAPENTPHA